MTQTTHNHKSTDTSSDEHIQSQEANKNGKIKKKDGLNNVTSTVAILIIALAIALVLTAFVSEAYQVDGPSMQTTLFNNDRLLVWKLPRTWARITGHQYIPKRGDIVIFSEGFSSSLGQYSDKQLVKRVIGLPGDHLVIKNNVVTIYNKAHPKGFDPDLTLPYGKVIKETSGNIDITVPQNQIFVMGDNRTDSLDSRIFGTVPTSSIVGQLVMVIWPVGQIKDF